MAAPSVCTVIVNFETPELTLDAARSVLAEPEAAGLVIVDNDSQDGSVEFLRSNLNDQRVRVLVSETNVGFGRGVNLGARECSAPFILLLNSDAQMNPGSLGALVDELAARPTVGAVAPKIFDARGHPQVDAFGEFFSMRTIFSRSNRHPTDTLEPDWISGAAILLRRGIFEELGGFDPRFAMYLEDVDLCRRVRKAGWGICRTEGALVTHLGGASRSSTRSRDRQYHESLLLYLSGAGYPKWQLVVFDPVHRLWQWGGRVVRRGP